MRTLRPYPAVHPFERGLLVLGALLVVGALLSALAQRSFLSLTALFVVAGFALGKGGFDVLALRPALGLRRGAGDRRAGRDPVPRRPRGRGRDAPALAPAAAQARARDADHRRDRRRDHPGAHRPRLDGDLPRRRAAVADRPGAVVERRDEPARAAAHPPLAQPRVRPQRRAGAAGRAGARRRAEPPRLHVVDVRAAGRRPRPRLRRRASAISRRCTSRGSGRGRALYALGAGFVAYGARCPAARQRASSRCSPARSSSASGGPRSARRSSAGPRTSSRSSSSGSSSCSARC